MQSSIRKTQDPFVKEIITTLVLGIFIGFIIFLFFKALEWIEIQHLIWNEQPIPYHLIGLPVVLYFLHELKKRTLYFPTQVSEVTSSRLELTQHWSPWMSFLHFIGNTLSHLVGASVGREGTAIMVSAGLVRALKLSWNQWGAVALTIGFSAVVGQPWVSLIFMIEVFSSTTRQKIYAVMGALVASLLLKTMQAPHLFKPVSISADPSFWQKLFFVILLGIVAGTMMKIYKTAYYNLSGYFKKQSILIKVVIALLLAIFLAQPQLRKFQSLGLMQINDIQMILAPLSDSVIKLFVTLISVTLGFWGGEFIPLVYAGLHIGNSIAQLLQFDLLLGTSLSAYLLFAAATRLKWSTVFLTLSLIGWDWWLWAYLLISICIHFSGPKSLYKANN